MDALENLMSEIVEAWGDGDLRPLLAMIHNEIVWHSAAPEWDQRLRSGGTHKGRTNVVALFSELSTAYFNRRCRTSEVLSRGNVVWGRFTVEGHYIPSKLASVVRPKPLEWEILLRWRIEQGKIIYARTHFDVGALLAQQL
jgi:hypothetical protein